MSKLMPRMLALMAVQRQTAASASISPWMREQHGSFGGVPMMTLSKPSRTLAHTPNLMASIGQVPVPVPVPGPEEPPLGAGLGVGLGLGLGLGVLPPHSPQAETREKKRRLRTRKRARDLESLEAMLICCKY